MDLTAEYVRDGSLVAVVIWVLKDMAMSLRAAATPKHETNQTTNVSGNGNGNAQILSAIHVEKAMDRFNITMEKMSDAMVHLAAESKIHSSLLVKVSNYITKNYAKLEVPNVQ